MISAKPAPSIVSAASGKPCGTGVPVNGSTPNLVVRTFTVSLSATTTLARAATRPAGRVIIAGRAGGVVTRTVADILGGHDVRRGRALGRVPRSEHPIPTRDIADHRIGDVDPGQRDLTGVGDLEGVVDRVADGVRSGIRNALVQTDPRACRPVRTLTSDPR